MEAFHQALHALFGHDLTAQAQANQWLNDFTTTSDAWHAALSLLDPSSPSQIAFFCANILLTKARRDWDDLPTSDRMAISQQASARLSSLSSRPPGSGIESAGGSEALVTHRLALALAAMAAQSGTDSAVQFAEQALAMASGAAQGGSEVRATYPHILHFK